MKIAILAAMDKELRLLKNIIPGYKEIRIGDSTYYEGSDGENSIILSKCGIGKVNSALNTYRLINELKPDLVINSGVAGGVDGSLGVGSVLIADKTSYHDVWCGPGTEPGAPDGFAKYLHPSDRILNKARALFKDSEDVTFGLICSGDSFIHRKEEVDTIKSKFPEAKAVDMESASIAQTCEMCGVPFAIVRVMSDTPGAAENLSQYENFWDKAPEKTFGCLKAILESLR